MPIPKLPIPIYTLITYIDQHIALINNMSALLQGEKRITFQQYNQNRGWSLIRKDNGEKGWVPSDYLAVHNTPNTRV